MARVNRYIVANWKLNPTTPREAKQLFGIIKKRANRLSRVTTVVCPPSPFLGLLGESKLSGSRVALGGQDAFWSIDGAYTGQVSPAMIKHSSARFVILGHSEVRTLGDTDEIIQAKVKAALKAGLKVILCIGENKRDQEGRYLQVLTDQLSAALAKTKTSDADNILIAYEPLWAIGQQAKRADTPAEFRHNAIFIKKVLSRLFSASAGQTVPVLYGGSVTVNNAASFLTDGQAEGLLVGRESLVPSRFGEILLQANNN